MHSQGAWSTSLWQKVEKVDSSNYWEDLFLIQTCPQQKKPCGVTAGVSTDIIGGTDDFDDYISTANQAFVI